jgi:hypothetical protein
MRPCADRRRPSARPNRTGRRRRPPVRHRSDSVCSDQHPSFSRWCGRGFWRRGSFDGRFLPGAGGVCAVGLSRRVGVDPLSRLRLTASSKRQIEIGGFVGRVTGRSAMRRSSGVRRPGFVGMVSGVAGHFRGPAGRDFSCAAGAGAPADALGRRSRSVPTAGRWHQRHRRAVGADGRTDEAFSAAFPALRDWLPVVIMPRGPPRRRRVGALRDETACCGLGGPNRV